MIDEQKVILDFSSILENYETSLVDQLRNFGLDGEIFETWVPDPDPIKSLVNLVDSTVESGAELVLDIRIKKETLSHIDIDRFRREINRNLAVEVTTIPDGLAIVVSGFGETESSGNYERHQKSDPDTILGVSVNKRETISSQQNVEETSHNTVSSGSQKNDLYNLPPLKEYAYRGNLSEIEGHCLIRGQHVGIDLELLINSDTHIIKKAAYSGAVSPQLRPILEKFCELIESLPILEASDHGVITLEHQLRKLSARNSVLGVVIPSAIDERFSKIEYVMRAAMEKYRQATGYTETWNRYDAGASKEWIEMSEEEKKCSIAPWLRAGLENFGFSPNDIEVTKIEYNVRVLVEFSGELAESDNDKQMILLYLENLIMERLEPRLELYLEPIKDQSKLRRLTS